MLAGGCTTSVPSAAVGLDCCATRERKPRNGNTPPPVPGCGRPHQITATSHTRRAAPGRALGQSVAFPFPHTTTVTSSAINHHEHTLHEWAPGRACAGVLSAPSRGAVAMGVGVARVSTRLYLAASSSLCRHLCVRRLAHASTTPGSKTAAPNVESAAHCSRKQMGHGCGTRCLIVRRAR